LFRRSNRFFFWEEEAVSKEGLTQIAGKAGRH
jgi:hypothetical protein